eukprot:14783281-Alexandrium_andersonii.AAC.1
MSASLVGSEMCIRDSYWLEARRRRLQGAAARTLPLAPRNGRSFFARVEDPRGRVSARAVGKHALALDER